MKIKPSRLKKGETIGIVSPARWMKEHELYKAASVFEQMGFRLKIASQNFLKQNQFAGNDDERVKVIEEMFEDREVNAIICAKGGYGSLRIVDMLNYDLIARNPKIFIGYSDIDAILISIYEMTGLVTFHGPMLYSFIGEVDPFNITYLQHSICNPEPYKAEFSKTSQVKVLRAGIAEGELFGGNLSILVNLIGTAHDFDTSGKILFIEDIDEYLYSLDRMLLHLRRASKLDKLAALIVGEMVNIKDNDIPFGKDVNEIILDICRETDFPIITNFPCGHGKHQLTIPISIKARLECNERGVILSLLESPIL
ncbi:MAG: LD-carboxypeptidase [candidate division Zixibacteria bacterium]|nr:LD-carboxypeptidase [candidate division Zixibacteria bacterium]